MNMFEAKTKTITRWGLTIRGSDVYFPKKETAIKIGTLSLKMNRKQRCLKNTDFGIYLTVILVS